MDKIFVTGATGFLGNNVVRELLHRGYFVHALVRNFHNIQIKHPNLKFFIGNILQKESLEPAMQECKKVIHIAAATEQNLLHYSDYRKINAEGTKNVFDVAKECNVQRFIYISSANTIGNGTESHPADESVSISYPFSESYYAKSKWEAQEFLLSNAENIEVIILNPAFMLGAYDMKPSSGALVLMGYRKPVLFIPKGGKNFIHAKDVTATICNALTLGKGGECYMLGNQNLSFKEFFKIQKKIAGYKQHVIILPSIFLYTIGHFGNLLQMLGIKVSFTKRNLKLLCVQEYYTSKKAIHDLNLPQTPIDKTIEDTVTWFKEQKKIR